VTQDVRWHASIHPQANYIKSRSDYAAQLSI